MYLSVSAPSIFILNFLKIMLKMLVGKSGKSTQHFEKSGAINMFATSLSVGNLNAQPRVFQCQGTLNAFND
jgi:hypothetical protein